MGILIDLNYWACFEGWFKHDDRADGRLRIINCDGWSEWTEKAIDFEKPRFNFNDFKKLTRRYEPPDYTLRNCSNSDLGVVKETAVEMYEGKFAMAVKQGKMTEERK